MIELTKWYTKLSHRENFQMFFQKYDYISVYSISYSTNPITFFRSNVSSSDSFCKRFCNDWSKREMRLRLLSFQNHFHAVRIVMYIKREDRVANKIWNRFLSSLATLSKPIFQMHLFYLLCIKAGASSNIVKF